MILAWRPQLASLIGALTVLIALTAGRDQPAAASRPD